MKIKHLFLALLAAGMTLSADAAKVKVTMNAVSKTMTLAAKDTEEKVETGAPSGTVYSFETPAGKYVLTAYGTDGKTVNGTITLDVADTDKEQAFTIITCTAYVSNKNGSTAWTVDKGDYTLDVVVNSREGVPTEQTYGNSVTAGRNTFLALNGNSYRVSFIPSEAHQSEGYMTLLKAGTLTGNINVQGAIPQGGEMTVSLPADARLELGIKLAHFIDLSPVEPTSTEIKGDTKECTFRLANSQMYFYRTWMEGGLTQGGYFTMSTDAAKCPKVEFTEADYKAFDPATINHSVQSNQGYETGDILLNINPQGYLRLNPGDTFDAHCMRMWELTDNSTSNNFVEPDFHYTILDLDGKPSTGVIEINQAEGSSWADLKAVGNGTAIVLVTYDAIGLNYYSGVNKTPYMGGEYWGAIWPENTGAYVVTVGQTESTANPNMLINEDYNKEALKMAGKYVDAEHDVFYYLDTEEGAHFTFTPENVAEVTMAYPTIGARMAIYTGFGTDGVTKNEDGSYTLLLKEGRQIVRLTDASGNATYQILTAKTCHREITNATREGSEVFQPGDKIKIQYSGLRHPANKIAGIYNMSAYVTYNGIPNGSSLILGSGQYTFGSAASAQAVTVDLPTDLDVSAQPNLEMTKGVIQVNGYGDPIGNHRTILRTAGRSPNFTAVAHKTYFGALPDIIIPLSAVKNFDIKVACNVADADITVSFNGAALTAGSEGLYSGTYGDYSVVATKEGYRCYRGTFRIADNAEGLQTFKVEMEKGVNAWDGKTLTEPALEDGVYVITNGNEMAWYGNHAGTTDVTASARLANDIDLANFEWTAIGTSTKQYQGTFEGNGHTIDGLYINKTLGYQGLFGYVINATITGVTINGKVSGKNYTGALVGYVNANTTIDRCVNNADVTGTSTYVGGLVGSLAQSTSKVTNSYNTGTVTGTSNCGGVAGYNHASAVIENVFNVGTVKGTTVGACVGGSTAKTNVKNAFATEEYAITSGQTLVSEEQMRSGEVAYKLGEAFGQEIGVDEHPVIGGVKVLYNPEEELYYNEKSAIESIDADGGNVPVAYYNLQGIASPKPFKGFNIVRYANGATAKIFVKD